MPEGTVSLEEQRKRRVVTVRLPEPMLEEIDEEARRRKVSRNRIIKDAIMNYLREQWKELSRVKQGLTEKDRAKIHRLHEEEFQKMREEYWRRRLTDPDFRPEDWTQIA